MRIQDAIEVAAEVPGIVHYVLFADDVDDFCNQNQLSLFEESRYNPGAEKIVVVLH